MTSRVEENQTFTCGSHVYQLRECWKRIQRLQKHLKKNKKDFYSKLTLAKLLSKRKRFLKYLKRTFPDHYEMIMRESLQS